MKRVVSIFLCVSIMISLSIGSFAAQPHRYQEQKLNERTVRFIEIDYNHQNIKPIVINAHDVMVSTESLKSMADRKGAFAAINGNYFSAYGATKYPVAANTIIKDGRIFCVADNKPVIGFKKDGSVIMDIISFKFRYYLEYSWCVPWNYNRPSTNPSAITIYTPDFGAPVEMPEGSKAVVLKDNVVQNFQQSPFTVPKGYTAVHCNKDTAYLIDQLKIGDQLTYKEEIVTKFTKPEDWEDVEYAVGAGPTLIINGQIIADPKAEGFTEPKIVTEAHPRSFIGITSDGIIKMGNINRATIAEAAQICQELKLKNAMCLDGGGSVNLYYNGKEINVGRDLNNALAFIMEKAPTGGDLLYQYKFIEGRSSTEKVLDEGGVFTREQMASIILEINGLLEDARLQKMESKFADTDQMGAWARPLIAYCAEHGILQGTGNQMFSPKSQVTGKMLAQLLLRALGYPEVQWNGVEQKMAELGLPVVNKKLTRGEAFDYIWKAITLPICSDGGILAVKLGKLKPEDLQRKNLNR